MTNRGIRDAVDCRGQQTTIFLVEPFYSGSHKAWADGLVEHSDHTVELITMPGERWRHRMRHSGAQLAAKINAAIEQQSAKETKNVVAHQGATSDRVPNAAIVLSSMTNAKDFVEGLDFRLPVLLYMHENQLGYPGSQADNEFARINIDSIEAVDHVAFNSQFHLEQMHMLLPTGLLDDKHIHVLEVGIDPPQFQHQPSSPPLVMFNHRWEFDKQPDIAISGFTLARDQVEFDLALCGEHFPGRHAIATAELNPKFAGYLPRSEYLAALAATDVIVSTSQHDYFGISIVEAMSYGAIPVLPGSLNYPNLVPIDLHTSLLYQPTTAEEFSSALIRTLKNLATFDRSVLQQHVTQFHWPKLIKIYDSVFDDLTNSAIT